MFVGREQALADLRAALATGNGVVLQAVHGLGGIGKSRLAAYYAATRSGDYSLVWWIRADTQEKIQDGLEALADVLEPALSEALPPKARRERATQWLACHDGWLLILDNVNDPNHIAWLTGKVKAGQFLITSRLATGWHNIASAVVRLDVLSLSEAMELLTRVAPRQVDGAEELCLELGCLPLAIEQAAAYIAQTGDTPRAYLALLAQFPAEMFATDSLVFSGEAGRTIARIWRVTLDRLAPDPLAGKILRILAWYAPDPIPRTILKGLDHPLYLHKAIGQLGAYGMITIGDDMTVTVHRLVQAVTRTPDPADPHRTAALIDKARSHATTQLAGAVPTTWDDPDKWPDWRTLLPHIEALAAHAPAATDTESTVDILNLTATFLYNQGALARRQGCSPAPSPTRSGCGARTTLGR